MKAQLKRHSGFTLTEFLVTTVVMGILVATSVPQIEKMVAQNSMQSDIAYLRSGFQLARSEAVARNSTVKICASANFTSCATGTGTLDQGWIVFEDNVVENGDVDAGEEIIRVGDKVLADADNTTFAVSVGDHEVTFSGQGRSDRAVEFEFCDSSGLADNRLIRIMPTGQINASMSNVPTC